jgi:hypothetical protein
MSFLPSSVKENDEVESTQFEISESTESQVHQLT